MPGSTPVRLEEGYVHEWGPLGEVLAAEPSERNRANVKDLVARAEDLLKLVRETFPRYTMHDERHAGNVVRLMGLMAGPRLDVLTGLEAALLVLAAYFHDAGMAYTQAELAAITDEDEFHAFLDRNDEAYLATRRNGGVPPEGVVEQYCRSRHAARVRVHLDGCDRSLLQWDGKSIAGALELICVSHHEPTVALHEPRFRTDFLYQADLRFCAIMLRLSDILDLDETRAPRVIYEHLALPGQASVEAAASDREWRKHLAARGFEFPPERRPNYRLQFVAEPEAPAVEHDLRQFLGVIEYELLQCRSVADVCGERWRGLPLPGEIDKSGITSVGYKYGEFRFEVDRSAVLELFTGDQLYEDPYVFIRELLQNALDAVRARTHLFGHESGGVQIWCWEDDGGYLWIRVDDDGIGMDEDTLRKYFLRIGKSYYRSAEFEADLGRRGLADQPFGVISRFGIGILSCFMVGDQVEVSTRRARADRGGRAVRLSINRRDDYFVLQESDREGREMPGWRGPEPAFPRSPGTRIAVRIDPNRAAIDLPTMLERTESFVFAPTVPVTANDRPIAADTVRLVTESIRRSPEITLIPTAHLPDDHEPEDAPFPYLGGIRLAAVPLSLGGVPECPDIRGQMLVYVPLPPVDRGENNDLLQGWVDRDEEIGSALRGAVLRTSFLLSLPEPYSGADALNLRVIRHLDQERVRQVRRIIAERGWTDDQGAIFHRMSQADRARQLFHHHAALATAVDRIPENGRLLTIISLPRREIHDDDLLRLMGGGDRARWSHNGVALPAIEFSGTRRIIHAYRDVVVFGSIALSNDLRPAMNISRTRIGSLSFPVHSALHFAVRRAARRSAADDPEFASLLAAICDTDLVPLSPTETLTGATFWADRLLRRGSWNDEPVIDSAGRQRSVADLHAAVRVGETPEVSTAGSTDWPSNYSFYRWLAKALLHFFVDVEWSPGLDDRHARLRVASADRPQLPNGTFLFPPLFAVRYRDDRALARSGPHLNATHPFPRWLIENAETLARDFPVPFRRIFLRAGELSDVEAVNEALARVARSRPAMAPPPEAYLREDDLGRWWSR